MAEAVFEESWITVYRDGESMFIVSPTEDGAAIEAVPVEVFEGAQANESAQFAIELALANWPEWGKELRGKYKPRTVITLPPSLPEA